MTAFLLDLSGDRPEQIRNSTGYITASGERLPDSGSAIEVHRQAGREQIDIRSIHRRPKDLGKCVTIVQHRNTMLVVGWRWRLHRSTSWCDWMSFASGDESSDRTIRTKDCGSCVSRKTVCTISTSTCMSKA